MAAPDQHMNNRNADDEMAAAPDSPDFLRWYAEVKRQQNRNMQLLRSAADKESISKRLEEEISLERPFLEMAQIDYNRSKAAADDYVKQVAKMTMEIEILSQDLEKNRRKFGEYRVNLRANFYELMIGAFPHQAVFDLYVNESNHAGGPTLSVAAVPDSAELFWVATRPIPTNWADLELELQQVVERQHMVTLQKQKLQLQKGIITLIETFQRPEVNIVDDEPRALRNGVSPRNSEMKKDQLRQLPPTERSNFMARLLNDERQLERVVEMSNEKIESLLLEKHEIEPETRRLEEETRRNKQKIRNDRRNMDDMVSWKRQAYEQQAIYEEERQLRLLNEAQNQ